MTYQNTEGEVEQSVISVNEVGAVTVFSTGGVPSVEMAGSDGKQSAQIDWPAKLTSLGIEIRAVDEAAER